MKEVYASGPAVADLAKQAFPSEQFRPFVAGRCGWCWRLRYCQRFGIEFGRGSKLHVNVHTLVLMSWSHLVL